MAMLQFAMHFKTDELATQFASLDKRLQLVLAYANFWCITEFGKPLLITHLLRTWTEQQDIYKDDPKFRIEPFHSVHEFKRGGDASLRDLGVDNAKKLRDHINKVFPYGGGKQTCLVHDVGHGNHIHFQVPA